MEQLISFAMKNFFIVIVIVGIVYQLFFRKSPLEKPRNRMPDFGGGHQRPPGSPPQKGVPMRIPPAKQEQPRPIPQPIVVEERVEEKAYAAEPPISPVPRKLREATPVDPAVATAPQPTQSLSREELARAVMWAEILGPPRARRPHRR